MSAPVLQSVLDFIAFFRSRTLTTADASAEERGITAAIAKAATALGCAMYWNEEYTSDPFKADSRILRDLEGLADLNDSGSKTGNPAGLQQRLITLRLELKRVEATIASHGMDIEKENSKLLQASTKIDGLREQIRFISEHLKDVKSSVIQDKLNKTFDRSWEELDNAVRRQIGTNLPGTIEDQGRLGEMSKRVELLKSRTDWLAQYVRDEKELALQDKLKRSLTGLWDQLETDLKAFQTLSLSVPQAVEPKRREKMQWERYASELKDLIGTLSAASEAYTTFRGALLDGSSGQTPLTRLLRAESLRDLLFDDKLQPRQGASIVSFSVQKLTGTREDVGLRLLTAGGKAAAEPYRGGVVLSFLQYAPTGKVKNSGVYTSYVPFK